MAFEGFPIAALDFYDDLEVNNSKAFWEANKHIYQEAVLGPMCTLCAELEAEFGAAKIYRPYRQVRFSKDKTPYKTHQGAFVGVGAETGYYVELSPRGVRTGAGFYWAPPDRLATFRDAIVDDKTGKALARIMNKLQKAEYGVGGETLKTNPRGYPADHSRIELLRHKQLFVSRDYGFDPLIHTAELGQHIQADWRAYGPLLSWLTKNVPVAAE
jgi:uncharacterized protein (TIGR02453 family)